MTYMLVFVLFQKKPIKLQSLFFLYRYIAL